MSLCCQQDDRRDAVRRMKGLNGLDYVEVRDDQLTLYLYFLGKLPAELAQNKPGIERYLIIEGGQRVTDIKILDADPVANPNPEQDDYLVLKLDKYGDFSNYTVRLTGVKNIDPRYDSVDFSFKINCPSDLDCARACACEPPTFVEPEINYLARDYQSFRQLIFDRLAVLIPDWQERHAADIGVMLVELLAYTGDYLSYYQDAVATEAYLETARQRISVRRHARLVDYFMHEGCNARAWVCVKVDSDLTLDPTEIAFITGLNDAVVPQKNVLSWDDLREVAVRSYEVFEPLVADRSAPIQLLKAHAEITFYTWGDTKCCLEQGSTSATLLDSWVAVKPPSPGKPPADYSGKAADYPADDRKSKPAKLKKERALKLQPGDVLIFEEVLGPVTGLAADADPRRRHAVRITRVTPGEDTLLKSKNGQPTPYVTIEWAADDALPFTFCLSAIGAAPDCSYFKNVSVARGNVILVDHGKTQDPEDFGPVPTLHTEANCECVDEPGDVVVFPGRLPVQLQKAPITFSMPLPRPSFPGQKPAAASILLAQDVKQALPQVWVASQPEGEWQSRYDLIESGSEDKHFVVEIDNRGLASLRFGNDELGFRPPVGMRFHVTYRVGNGAAGNVGAESISRLVLKKTQLSGVSIEVRNPLAARGGTEPEPIAHAKLFAPHAFRKELQRAIIADDYQKILGRNTKLQRTSGALVWTGSWYEADVAVDPLGREVTDDSLLTELQASLERFRRMGHDLGMTRARYVPLHLSLEVCALPHFRQAHVKAALLDAFSNRILPGGKRGFFHPDNLTFGENIFLSQIIATAQAVTGVECVHVKQFQRLFESANHEIENGVLPLRKAEIAQLDNDPNYPERGRLEIHVGGGR